MKHSILIVNYNLKNSVIRLCEQIAKQYQSSSSPTPYEILIFDNASADGSREYFENQTSPRLKYVFSETNLGFGMAMNHLASLAVGELLILLNPDLEIPTQDLTLPEWVRFEWSNRCVILAPRLVGLDLRPQANGGGYSNLSSFVFQAVRVGVFLRKFHIIPILRSVFRWPLLRTTRYAKYLENFDRPGELASGSQVFDWISGAFWVLRKSDFQCAGGFDEQYFLYCEDEDLCRRLKQLTRLPIIKSNRFYAVHAVGGADPQVQRFSKARLSRFDSNLYFLRQWGTPSSVLVLRFFYILYFVFFLRLDLASRILRCRAVGIEVAAGLK